VQRIGRVDGPVGTLDGLARVVELGAGAGVDAVALDLGRAEGGQHLSRGADRLDVAVATVEEIAAGLLGHVVTEVDDQREGAGHRPGRRVEGQARGAVLHQADEEPEVASRAGREEGGGIPLLGVDRPQQRAGGENLSTAVP